MSPADCDLSAIVLNRRECELTLHETLNSETCMCNLITCQPTCACELLAVVCEYTDCAL